MGVVSRTHSEPFSGVGGQGLPSLGCRCVSPALDTAGSSQAGPPGSRGRIGGPSLQAHRVSVCLAATPPTLPSGKTASPLVVAWSSQWPAHSAKRRARGPNGVSVCRHHPQKECGWRLSHPWQVPKGTHRRPPPTPPAPTLTLELPGVPLEFVLSRYKAPTGNNIGGSGLPHGRTLTRIRGVRKGAWSRGRAGFRGTEGLTGTDWDRGCCSQVGMWGLAAVDPSVDLCDLQPEGGGGGALGSQSSVLGLCPGH